MINKVFGIGLERSGTTSLTDALNILGYSSAHWISEPYFEHALATYRAVIDMPVTKRYPQLDRRFPGSKFVLTHRRLDGWLESCRRWYFTHPPSGISNPYRIEFYGIPYFDPKVFREAYHRHHSEVSDYFKGREEDLLRIEICQGEGWEKLCPFLGVEIPNVPFPQSNKNPLV